MGQGPADRPQEIDGREPPALGDAAVKDDMPVQDPAQDIGHGFVHVRPRDQHREDRRDVARPHRPWPGTFGQPHDRLGQGRRIAAQAGILAPGQRDFAVRLGKAGDAVDQEEHMPSLVAEMLGHRHRRQGAGPPLQGRLVRGRRDHDRARHALGAKHAFGEFAQFAPAFADQGDDDDLCLDPAGKAGQKRGFADARACEKPDPLAPDQGQQRVEDGGTGGKPFPEPPPQGRRGRRAAQGPRDRTAQQGPPVQGAPGGIDNAADPAVIRRDLGPAQKLHPVADRHAVARSVGQDRAGARVKPQHLALSHTVAAVDADPVAQRGRLKPGHLHQAAARLDHLAQPPHGRRSGDFRQKTVEKSSHGILPLFAFNGF